MLTAGIRNSPKFIHGIVEKVRRFSLIRERGIAPTSATGKSMNSWTTNATMMANSDEGNRAFHFLGHRTMMTTTRIPKRTGQSCGANPSVP